MNVLKCNCAAAWGDIAPLFLRVATGAVFFMHGWQKLGMGVPGVAGFLGSLGFPMPEVFAYLLIGGELIGGAALVLGLFTHWAAKVTSIIALVALLTVHLTKGFFVNEGGYEFIALLFAASISLMITGAGKYSVDRVLRG